MALDPLKHRARRVAAGAIALSAAIAAATTLPTTVFAQRAGKGAAAKAPSVIIDLGVLQELGGAASVEEPEGKSSVRAPVLRAPRKRPGAPAPLFLPPRSADERVAKASGKSPKRSASKKTTGKSSVAARAKAPAPRAKPAASERGKSVETSSKKSAEAAKPTEMVKAVPAETGTADRGTVAQAEEKSVAAKAPERKTVSKTAMVKSEDGKTAEPSPVAPTNTAVAFPTASTTVTSALEETPAIPVKQAPPEADTATPVVAKEEPPAPETVTAEATPETQPADDIVKPDVASESRPDTTAVESAGSMRSAMIGDPADAGRKSEHATAETTKTAVKPATDAVKPDSETVHADTTPAGKPPADKLQVDKPAADKPKGWMASLINKVPASTALPDSAAKDEIKATAPVAPAANQTVEQTAPKTVRTQAVPPEVVRESKRADAVQVARATPEPTREEPESRSRFDDPVRLVFSGDGSRLDDEAKSKVQALVDHLKGDSLLRLRLLSYVDGKNRSRRAARQLSLFRALAVRSYLIKKGISSARIEVRPQGDNTTRTPRDRVDLVVSSR